jgi:hypothetical protein
MPNFLIVQRGPEIGQKYELEDKVTTVGRSADNDITLEDPYVSRYHAVIKPQDDKLAIIDLGSENPVLIRDTPLDPGQVYVLQHRDVVRIGQNVFSFINSSAIVRPANAPALDSYQSIPPMPAEVGNFAPAANASQASDFQPALENPGSKPASVSGQSDDSATKPATSYGVVDQEATMVGTNFASLLGKPAAASEAPLTGSNPANSYSFGSLGGSESSADKITGSYAVKPEEAAQTHGYTPTGTDSKAEDDAVTNVGSYQPAPSTTNTGYNQYGQYNTNQFGEIPGATKTPLTSAEDDANASTTVVNASALGSSPTQPPTNYTPAQPQYNQDPQQGQYGQYNQYGQTGQYQNPPQQGQYGQYNQYGQTGQYQNPPQQGQYGQYNQYGQTGQYQNPPQQGQYGQYNQYGQTGQYQTGQNPPQAQYNQYGQAQYNQYGQAQPPVEGEANQNKPEDKSTTAQPEEKYNPEDAPTTIIRIDKTKL